ncbi:MAG: hypothetical protein PHN45_00185 [Methylococcales bacterium]|nr:hypothetical protein [Methylococcales bacterium]
MASNEYTYVLQMENFTGNVMAKPLGQSRSNQYIHKFSIYVASRELIGKDWNPREDPNIFYDPSIDSVEPRCEYLRWMNDEEIEELKTLYYIGATCTSGMLHISDSSNTTHDGHRKIRRRYCIYQVQCTIYDLMAMETEGDRALANMVGTPLSLPPSTQLPPSATAAVQKSLDMVNESMAKYLPPSITTHLALTQEATNVVITE